MAKKDIGTLNAKKHSLKMQGKEVGFASVYAEPHTMTGKEYNINSAQKYVSDPNNMSAMESTPGGMPARRVSMGNPARPDADKPGIKIRGTGAATKGVMARGPMA